MNMKFFIDTADIGYIEKLWEDKLRKGVDRRAVVGVTTNPNAFAKVNLNTIAEWKDRTRALCKLVTSIRKDGKGVVYVQMPNSAMSPSEALAWVKMIRTWTDGKTKVALKIPPFKNILEITDKLAKYAEVNVTGVADCSTALRAFSYGVRYVSIIPGRMEEQGIDAKAHIAFTNQRKSDGNEIIAGSMRTVEGLKWTCAYGTVPTIGTRVWDVLFDAVTIPQFKKFWTPDKQASIDPLFSPHVDQRMTDLSRTFFEQMDSLGKSVYAEFARKL